jgi:hypothetical protein
MRLRIVSRLDMRSASVPTDANIRDANGCRTVRVQLLYRQAFMIRRNCSLAQPLINSGDAACSDLLLQKGGSWRSSRPTASHCGVVDINSTSNPINMLGSCASTGAASTLAYMAFRNRYLMPLAPRNLLQSIWASGLHPTYSRICGALPSPPPAGPNSGLDLK